MRLADVAARSIITVGGIGTIVAVCGVFAFLFVVVAPLFRGASISDVRTLPVPHPQPIQRLAIDEYRTLGWSLVSDGTLKLISLADGKLLEEQPVVKSGKVTAVSFLIGADDVALGLEDGHVRLGQIGFKPSFPNEDDLPEEIQQLPIGGQSEWQGGIIQRTEQGALRLQKLALSWEDPMPLVDEPIRKLAHVVQHGDTGISGGRLAAVTDSGRVVICPIETEEDLLTFSTKIALGKPREVRPAGDGPAPDFLQLAGRGEMLLLGWQDGLVERYNVRGKKIELSERLQILEPGAELTAFDLLLGRSTLVCGDSTGRVQGLFVVRSDALSSAKTATPSDGTNDPLLEAAESSPPPDDTAQSTSILRLVSAHDFPGSGPAVTCLAMSTRRRMFVVGYADGTLRTFFMTTERELVETEIAADSPVLAVGIAPKEDGLFAATADAFWECDFDPKHPEATITSIFGKVWYEGYPRPEHVWQSSGGTSDVEPKFSMWPLIFGTIKATFYSMMFGTPIALLAAVVTSEFLHPRARARIKPTIEMMASLPSVVLGFLAALVFAPFIQQWLPAVLLLFVTVPFAFLLGAHLWQLVPYRLSVQLGWMRYVLAGLMLIGGIAVSIEFGPWLESRFFGGNMMQWTDGQVGDGTGAWIMILLPLVTMFAALGSARYVNPWLRRHAREYGRGQFAVINLVKFLALSGIVIGGAWLLATGLSAVGWDPRGTFVDTYVQRNALVVGFVMGFAIIPIIYTIAEDALSTVPQHLRSASLGTGATPWQTAIYIVIPTAMSGLFAALMIGLGRAVGETMIVLMAAGNTPIMELNVFNGFRTLSANIAVELPEAVRDSTHYRTLFLAALTLFLMTFLVNTVAEVVRLRFRRRAYQL